MNKEQDKQTYLLLFGMLAILVIWAAVKAAPFVSGGLIGMVQGVMDGMNAPFSLTWTADTPRCILLFLLIYTVGVGIFLSTRRNYRTREEHGSAKWGNAKALNAKYANHKEPEQNIILTQNVRMGLDGHKHRRNLNVLVVGGSGAGKTRGYCKPNILQCNTSFVCLDPKGELLRDTGHLLEQRGYEIRVLDLINMHRSFCYNPFAYLRDEKDVLKLVNNLVKNTTPKGASSNDPFWERAETALMEALILYLMQAAPPEEQNFPMVMELIGAAEVRENDDSYESILDELFSRLELCEPNSLAAKQYHLFKLANGKTASSILVSLAVRLEKFNLPQLSRITCHDELDLGSLGEKKVALFACIPDNDSSLNYIIGMMYTQLFQELFYKADHEYGGALPMPVHFVMDEFSNVALPDEFDKILSVARSRRVSMSIILQNLAQLKALFEKQWEGIAGNCDSFLYLGGNEAGTHEYVSKQLGKETIDLNTYNESKGRSGNYTKNMQLSGRELLTPDEVRMLDNRHALLFIRGEHAVRDDKYDLLRHPNLKQTADGGLPPYIHGQTPLAFDVAEIDLPGAYADYIVLDESDIEELLHKKLEEETK